MEDDTNTDRRTGTDLVALYRRRLRIGDDVDLSPTWGTLQLLVERHLAHVPFENLSLHTKKKTASVMNDTNEPETTTAAPSTTTNKTRSKDDHCCYNKIGDDDDDDDDDDDVIVLEETELIQKVLIERRGGCCLELNGLFAMLLERLRYASVRLVPCYVAAGKERGKKNLNNNNADRASGDAARRSSKFRTTAGHFIIVVDGKYIVDVGLGEPPMGPLHYHNGMIGRVQTTPDGMKSRIRWDPQGTWIDGRTGQKRTCLILEWWWWCRCNDDDDDDDDDDDNNNNNNSNNNIQKEGTHHWQPRLQWDVSDAPLSGAPVSDATMTARIETPPRSIVRTDHQEPVVRQLRSFAHVRELLLHPKSTFRRKLIVCRVTRDAKITLAGRSLKITTPRFGSTTTSTTGGDGETLIYPRQTIIPLSTTTDVLRVLHKEFGILLKGHQQLDFTRTDHASNTKLWDHL